MQKLTMTFTVREEDGLYVAENSDHPDEAGYGPTPHLALADLFLALGRVLYGASVDELFVSEKSNEKLEN